MSDTFKFTPLRMSTPFYNLTAAIGIIQASIMAEGSEVAPEVTFGRNYFPTEPLETAVALLVGALGPVEELQWRDAGTQQGGAA